MLSWRRLLATVLGLHQLSLARPAQAQLTLLLRASGWRASGGGSARGLASTATCPLVAAERSSDVNGDCVCPINRPTCYDRGRPSCPRADGFQDFHYFSARCETCDCRTSDGATTPAPAPSAGCGTDGAVGDVFGTCKCPALKPLCIVKVGAAESLACPLPVGYRDSTNVFATGCVGCLCRQACAKFARSPFADSFGDCACPSSAPHCYQGGAHGCTSSALGNVLSNTYFAGTCTNCECRVAAGVCDTQCLVRSDCADSECMQCDICVGVQRCPDVGVLSALPDVTGNCECASGTSCFQVGSTYAGCPLTPSGQSTTRFQPSCQDCECRATSQTYQGAGTVACPTFAAQPAPDGFGDCACPASAPDCYQAGRRWCTKTDATRELHYFSAFCADCTCQAALPAAQLAKVKPCPSFARAPESDGYGNCDCPPETPLCVQGAWPKGAAPADSTRPGPPCNTSFGWTSSNLFRADCQDCNCSSVQGEGDRAIRIPQSDIFTVAGSQYVREALVVDLRLVNTMDSIDNWTLVEQDVFNDQLARNAFANACNGGLSQLELESTAVLANLTLQEAKTYYDAAIETAYAWRIQVGFGITWTTRINRLLRALQVAAATSTVTPASALPGRGMRAKNIAEFTPRETLLLVNFPSIFSEVLFKEQLDLQLAEHLNATWTARRDALIKKAEAAAAAAGGNVSAERVRLEAPRLAVTKVVINDVPLEALSLTGPLEPQLPARYPVDRGPPPAQKVLQIPWQWIGVGVGSCCGLCCCTACCACARSICMERRKERREREQATQAEKAVAASSAKDGTPHGSSVHGSPSSPAGRRWTGSPRMGQLSGRRSRGANMLAGMGVTMTGSSSKDAAPDSPRGMSPRATPSPRGAPVGGTQSSPRLSDQQPGKSKTRWFQFWRKTTTSSSSTNVSDSPRMLGKGDVDLKIIRSLGDLAGHKTLSSAARAALQAEHDQHEEAKKGNTRPQRRRISVGKATTHLVKRVSKMSGRSASPRSSVGSPIGSARSSGGSSPRSGSASGGESPPQSPRSVASGAS